MKVRDYFFDNLKVLLVFLVVIGHVWGLYGLNIPHFNSVYVFIYLFHMPLFMFINGYFSKNTDKPITQHINQLLMPFIAFEVIWWAYDTVILGMHRLPFIVPYSYLWYLIALFAFRAAAKYIVSIPYMLPISIVIGALSGLVDIPNLLGFFKILGFLPFFLLGYYTDREQILKVRKLPATMGAAFLLVGAIFASLYSKFGISDVFLYYEKSFADIGMSNLEGVLGRVILYVIAIVTSIGIIRFMPDKSFKFTDIGERTMVIYLGHMFFRVLIMMVIPKWSESLLDNAVILISPFFIMWFLSLKIWTKLYNLVFDKVSIKLNHNVDSLK